MCLMDKGRFKKFMLCKLVDFPLSGWVPLVH